MLSKKVYVPFKAAIPFFSYVTAKNGLKNKFLLCSSFLWNCIRRTNLLIQIHDFRRFSFDIHICYPLGTLALRVKNIQAAAYNGARTISSSTGIYLPLSKVNLIPLGLLIEINAWNLRVHLRSSPEITVYVLGQWVLCFSYIQGRALSFLLAGLG